MRESYLICAMILAHITSYFGYTSSSQDASSANLVRVDTADDPGGATSEAAEIAVFRRSMALRAKPTSPVMDDTYGWLYQDGPSAVEFNQNLVPRNWQNYDGFRSIVTATKGTSIVNTTAFNAYVRNLTRERSGGLAHAAVGYSSGITCEVSGCASWAMNPTITDTLGRAALPTDQTYSAKLIGAEFDISVKNAGSTVTGISLLGSSKAQPTYAQAYNCGSLGGPALWDHCYVVTDGVLKKDGLLLGSVGATGTPASPSASINMNWYASNSAIQKPVGGQIQLQAVLGTLRITDIYKDNGISISPASADRYPAITATGKLQRIDLGLSAKNGYLRLESPMIEVLTTPKSSKASCIRGQFEDDENYHYVCVSDSTWKRVALSAF